MESINSNKNKLNSEIIFIFHPKPNAYLIATQLHTKGLSFTFICSNCVENLVLFGTLKVERGTMLKSNIIL